MKKFWQFWKSFWVAIWKIVKSMSGWRGIVSLLITWLVLSGALFIGLGFILKLMKVPGADWIYGTGLTISAFWLAPFTPLVPITIAMALLTQRFVFRDKSISWKSIKDKFQEAFRKQEKAKPVFYVKI